MEARLVFGAQMEKRAPPETSIGPCARSGIRTFNLGRAAHGGTRPYRCRRFDLGSRRGNRTCASLCPPEAPLSSAARPVVADAGAANAHGGKPLMLTTGLPAKNAHLI